MQRREIRRAVLVEGHDLAVDQAIGQGVGLARDAPELRRPVEALARAQRRASLLDAQLHAIAVELDLVAPAFALGRMIDELGELGLEENRHLHGCLLARRHLSRRA